MSSGGDPTKLETAKRSFSRNTLLVGRYGRVLLWALIIEIFLPIIFREHTSLIETVIGVACAFAVAVGVWGEIHFGEKADEAAEELKDEADRQIAAADERAALANERAAEAHARASEADARAAEAMSNVETERAARLREEALRADRGLSTEQFETLVARLRPLGELDVGVFFPAALEPMNFGKSLINVFSFLGWRVAWATRVDPTVMRGIWIEVPREKMPTYEPLAAELIAAFREVGIRVFSFVSESKGGTFAGEEPYKSVATSSPILINVGTHPRGF